MKRPLYVILLAILTLAVILPMAGCSGNSANGGGPDVPTKKYPGQGAKGAAPPETTKQ
ncbi:MAG: hypothetical protein P4L46_01765 [Fimbriimonas sp.]|nr:hypothetical protein [Fimbriimonas sp.]